MKAAVTLFLATGLGVGLMHPALYAEGKVERAAENAANKVEQAVENLKTEAYDLVDKDITAVTFKKGSATLSKSDASSLRAVYKAVLNDNTVDKVIVAAWADEQMPSGGKLSDAQVELADKRADAIENLLEKMGNKNVDTYNMAKDATWIGKVFETQNAEVKEAVKGTPADDPNANRIAQLLEAKGGVSKAVVIVKRNVPARKAASN
ncbi:OmpA family protein [Oligoflexus tunisiensis]|uniref:OmpA family protein n=1 Tax=Oligoflexus tunisiensis TaxID=708132 RepID=UPI00114C9C5D|nr:OmpA family protein [Oligoflexus tunisiensis]